ncbi:hypothetical protein BS50DRAFT_471349, partial [Corynespora cassiicola Philippines]
SEFAFNILTDVAPLLALFGEQFARQFISESLVRLYHIVFAMVPLRIISTMTGAIRDSGPTWARAFIGRARESRATAEIGLMSSTSREVCEVYNGKAVVRAMGSPKITQFILLLGRRYNDPRLCLHTMETAYNAGVLEHGQFGIKNDWNTGSNDSPKSTVSSRSGKKVVHPESKLRYRFRFSRRNGSQTHPPSTSLKSLEDGIQASSNKIYGQERKPIRHEISAPNLQLNLPDSAPSHYRVIIELWLAALISTMIQAIVFITAALTSLHPATRARVNATDIKYGFPLFIGGTILLNIGMIICSWVIERGTREYIWRRCSQYVNVAIQPIDDIETLKTGPKKLQSRFQLFWLQHKHTVNDQNFDSHLILGGVESEILTSSRIE